MCISAILGVGSALIGAGSASKAAKSQKQASDQQLALQERVYEETTERFQPYADAGGDYNAALRYELLGGDRPTFGGTAPAITEEQYAIEGQVPAAGPRVEFGGGVSEGGVWGVPDRTGTRYNVNGQSFDTRELAESYANANQTGGGEYRGFQATPGYQFALNEGQRSIDNSAASSGALFSGATLRAQQQYGQGMANQEYNNYLNRLTGGAASGQAAAGNQANAGANLAMGGSAAIGARGDAGAAGAIGVGNAIQGGINNALGMWNYQNQRNAGLSSLPGGTQAGIW